MATKPSNKIFIPLTLDNSTKSTFGEKQMLATGGLVLVFAFVQLGIFIVHSNYNGIYWYANLWFLLPLDFVLSYILLWIFRKSVMNENMLLKVYAKNKAKEVTDLGFMWDIFDIKGNKIYYINGRVGTVIDVQHGYIFDRPPNHEDLHRATIKKAIADIANRGYLVDYRNDETKDTNLEPLFKTEKLLQRERGTPVYNLGMDVLNHTKNVCRNIATIEHEYFLLVAPDMYTIQGLDQAAEEFINNLRGGLYNFITRLSGLEILDWFCRINGIKFIDVAKLLTNKFRFEEIRLVEVLETIRSNQDAGDGDSDNHPAVDSVFEEYMAMLRASGATIVEEDDIII